MKLLDKTARHCGALIVTPLLIALPASAQVVTIGSVVDSLTGNPLPGVVVRVERTEVITDADGGFRIALVAPASVIVFERVGYRVLRLPVGKLGRLVRLVPEPVLLDAVTVDRTREVPLAAGTALTVQTVEADVIRHGAHTSVAEALSAVEGLDVTRVGSWGARPSLRGLDGERVAVLIDGSRVNRACAFGMDQGMSAIDPATVERVEILTGPGSAVYGSGNLGGVINVVTRAPAPGRSPSAEIRAGASTAIPGGTLGGTFGLQHKRFSATVAVDGASYGDYSAARSKAENSSFRQATAALRADYDFAQAGRLSFQAQDYEGRDIGWPSMAGASIPSESRRNFAIDYGAQLALGVVDAVAARAYVQRLDHDMIVSMSSVSSNGMPMLSSTNQRSHSTTSGGRLQIRLLPIRSAHLDVGAELTNWSAENSRWTTRDGVPTILSYRTWPATQITDAGVFAQGEVNVTRELAATAGLRVDYAKRSAEGWPDTDEWISTGNVGMRLALPASWETRVSVGWGYRLPDPTELFGLALRPDGFIYTGNSHLTTERGRNIEAGLSRSAGALFTSLTVFRNELTDLISPVLVPGDTISGMPVRSYANLKEARIEGVSASARLKATTHVQISGTASYTEGRDMQTDRYLPRISPLHGSLAARYEPGWRALSSIELEAEGATRQTRVSSTTGEAETPAYLVLNGRLSREVARTKVTLGVDNIFDRDYRGHLDPVSLARPGRNLFVRVSRAFGE